MHTEVETAKEERRKEEVGGMGRTGRGWRKRMVFFLERGCVLPAQEDLGRQCVGYRGKLLRSLRSQSSCIRGYLGTQQVGSRGFPGGACGEEPAGNAGDIRDMGSIPGPGRSPGEGNGNPLQSSCLENPMDRGAWWATVHGVPRSRTRLKQLSTQSHK